MLFEQYSNTSWQVCDAAAQRGPTHNPAITAIATRNRWGFYTRQRPFSRRIPGAPSIDLDAGCCGMAGSFGYTREHYDVSRQIGERKLFPAHARSAADAVCRVRRTPAAIKSKDFTGGRAIHPGCTAAVTARRCDLMNLACDLLLPHCSWPSSSVATTKLNVGVLSLALAWIIGVYLGGMIKIGDRHGFPVQLFLTLVGVTMLFAQAHINGTLDKLRARAVRGAAATPADPRHVLLRSRWPGVDRTGQHRDRGAAGADGDGGRRTRRHAAVPDGNHGRQRRQGRSALALCATGIIVNGIMARSAWPASSGRPISTISWPSAVAFVGYRAVRRPAAVRVGDACRPTRPEAADAEPSTQPLAHPRRHRRDTHRRRDPSEINVGMAAFVGATILALLGAADHTEAIKKIPWNVIADGLRRHRPHRSPREDAGHALFTDLLARVATKNTVTGSSPSSPDDLGLQQHLRHRVPAFCQRCRAGRALGGGVPDGHRLVDGPVGGHLVDLSPLFHHRRALHRRPPGGHRRPPVVQPAAGLGMSMVIVGTVVCWIPLLSVSSPGVCVSARRIRLRPAGQGATTENPLKYIEEGRTPPAGMQRRAEVRRLQQTRHSSIRAGQCRKDRDRARACCCSPEAALVRET